MSRKKYVLKAAVGILLLFAATFSYLQLHGSFQSDILSANGDIADDNIFIERDNTDVSAHRMGAGMFPEDTLMSAEGLIEGNNKGLYNVKVIELDLRMTKDGELILLHDSTLDRTTDSEEVFGVSDAEPGEYTISELMKLNFGAKFQDEDGNYPYSRFKDDDVPDNLRVVKLQTLLDYLVSNGDFKYILEIKDSESTGLKAIDKLARIVKEYGIEEQTIIASFHEELLYYLDDAYPKLKRHASMSEVVEFTIDFFLNKNNDNKDYQYEVLDITPRYGILLGEEYGQKYGILNLMSQGYINRAHECGLAVYYWTVNSKGTANKLVKRNADCIITDYPDIVKQ